MSVQKGIIIDYNEQRRYFVKLQSRLEIGAQEYGDKSFSRPETNLIEMIQEEVLDIAGWSYILWAKLERLKAKIPS